MRGHSGEVSFVSTRQRGGKRWVGGGGGGMDIDELDICVTSPMFVLVDILVVVQFILVPFPRCGE